MKYLVLISLLFISLLVGCAVKKEEEKKASSTSAKSSSSSSSNTSAPAATGIVSATYKISPVILTWEVSNGFVGNYQIQVCYKDGTCEDFLFVNCADVSTCVVKNASGNERANYAFAAESVNGNTKYNFEDYYWSTLGSGTEYVRIRKTNSGDGPWVRASQK